MKLGSFDVSKSDQKDLCRQESSRAICVSQHDESRRWRLVNLTLLSVYDRPAIPFAERFRVDSHLPAFSAFKETHSWN